MGWPLRSVGVPVVALANAGLRALQVGADLAAEVMQAPGRGAWLHGSRAWVEVPDRGDASYAAGVGGAVAQAVRSLPGVVGAEVNAALQRVVVEFEAPPASLEGVLRLVTHVEQEWVQSHPPTREAAPAVAFPGDHRQLALRAAGVGADALGLTAAAAGSLMRWPRVPLLGPAVTTLVDSQARLRGQLECRLGRESADALIACANAMMQAAAGATPALAVDLVGRWLTAAEAHANRGAWARQEPRLARYAAHAQPTGAARPRPRTERLADRYEDLAAAAGLLAGSAFLVAGRPTSAGAAVLASVPKAARYGREAFASTVGRLLCEQDGGLLLRGEALRLLGAVDAIVIDPRVLLSDAMTVTELRGVTGGDRDRLWRLATEDVTEGLLGPGWHRLDALSPTHDTQGLPAEATILVSCLPEPLALAILDAARSAGLLVASLDVDWLGSLRSSFDELQSAGQPDLAFAASREASAGESAAVEELVTRLQAQGHTVAVLGSAGATGAMPAADIGIGVGERPVWSADVLVPGLGAAWRLVNAVPASRNLGRRLVELSVGGSLLESLLTLVPGRRRAPGPVVTAGGLGLVAGWRAAQDVMAQRLPPVLPSFAWHTMTPRQVRRLLPVPEPRQHPPDVGSTAAESRDDWVHSAARVARRVVSVAREDLDDPMSPVLATGAAASAVLGSPSDAVLVSSVLLGNALLSGVQRMRAEAVLSRLLARNGVQARVVVGEVPEEVELAPGRRYVQVSGSDVRCGEVIEVRAGEVVPADARVLWVHSVEVDESSLTGESLPVTKQVEATPGAPLAERACMVYEGTVVLTGTVLGVVTATGDATEAGRALALSPSRSREVGLQAQLGRLTGSVLPFTVASGVGVTALGLLRGAAVREAVASGVAITVAAVPEGLPLIATLAQQAAARRLAGLGVLVRTPSAVETLGRVEVVCFDKTGTLTENRLSVRTYHLCPGVRRARLLEAAALASPALGDERGTRHSTDAAVATYCSRHRPACDAELPFRPGRPFSSGLSGARLAVKGAPEVVLAACGTSVAQWPQVEQLAARGLRVLAVAERVLAPRLVQEALTDPDALARSASEGLTLLGFLGISDTVRRGARELMDDLAARHVRPVVITGDHPVTAGAVVADLGRDVTPSQVLTGDQWGALPRRRRLEAVRRVTVFARMSPEQKVQVVQSIEEAGLVSAMVGDGANDAAAIRAASVGIGVATHGSDPARGAADVVLLDGHIGSLSCALDEGGQLWRSVQAAVTVLLGGNAGELAFTTIGVALTGRAPLNSRQLLLVNLLTDALPAAAVAVSRPRGGARDGPRGLDEDELWRRVLERGATTTLGATSAWALARLTGRARRASTVGLVALVATQLGQTVVDAPTPLVIATAGGSLAALAAAVTVPGMSQALGCTPIGPLGWAQALGCAATATAVGALAPAVRGIPPARPTAAPPRASASATVPERPPSSTSDVGRAPQAVARSSTSWERP